MAGRSAKTKRETIVQNAKFLYMKNFKLGLSILAAAIPVILKVLEDQEKKEGNKDS